MKTVGTAVLKNRLSEYLDHVKNGQNVIVTDRGVPVAQIIPIQAEDDSQESIVRQLQAKGVLSKPKKEHFAEIKPIDLNGDYASQILIEMRDEG